MLNLLRQHARSWIIKFLLLLIVIVFIFWGGYTYHDRDRDTIATVNDRAITIGEYNRAYDQLVEMYRRQLGEAFSADMIRQFNVRQQALEMLIERHLLLMAAQELGLTATVDEIRDQILQYPVFQTNGRFDEQQYRLVLQQSRMTPESFEQQLGQDLSLMKVEDFIRRRAMVTEEEILAELKFNHSPIEIAYVIFDPASMEEKVSVQEEDLEAFFNESQMHYREPEKRQLSYVLFQPEDFFHEVELTEEELRRSFEERILDYHHPAQVHARHILFRVDETASEEDVARVRAEGERVLAEARRGEDFAELARKHSEDPSAVDNEGDLGWFSRDRMIPQFADVAFSLEEGEISDLVRTPFGFHIIQVLGVRQERTESFEEVKERLEASIKKERARDVAYRRALTFSDMAYGLQDLERAAEIQGRTLAQRGIWVSQRDSLPGMEMTSPEVMQEIFSMSEQEVSRVLETPEGYLVASVDAVRPPQTPALEDVRERVVLDFQRSEASNLARERASSFLKAARDVGSLESAAQEKNLELKRSGWFSRNEPPRELAQLRGPSLDALFQLEETRPFPSEPFPLGGHYLVAELLGKKAPDLHDPEKRELVSARLLEQKQVALWNAWLEQQRNRAKIKILSEI